MDTELELAYNHCQRVAKEQGKNFYYGFRMLPYRKRRAIYAAYAFCRYCDDIADDDLPQEEKKRLLDHTQKLLTASWNGQATNPLFAALVHASHTFEIPDHYFREVIEGVEMDLTRTRFQNFDQLYTYCYKVASSVGLICVEIFGYKDRKALDYAVDFGVAMQLTNIIRDIKEDAERGRIYIPLDELYSFGYSEAELMKGVVNKAFMTLMNFQANRARRYFDRGAQLIPLLPYESRACPSILHGVYNVILDRIESSGFNVFNKRIRLSRMEKLLICVKFWLIGLMPTATTRTR